MILAFTKSRGFDFALLERKGVNSQLHFLPLSLSPFPQVSSDAITDFVFVIAVAMVAM